MQWFAVLVILALGVLSLVWWWTTFRKQRLHGAARVRIEGQLRAAAALGDPARRVVEADIVLDHALREIGYQGTLGDKLKKAGARFRDLDAVWRAHKLRNRIAHEPGVHVSDAEAAAALRAVESAIRDLC